MARSWVPHTAALVAALLLTPAARADEVAVPLGLQTELLSRVAAYDKNLEQRAGDDPIELLVLRKPQEPRSVGAAEQLQSALGELPLFAGRAHRLAIADFAGAAGIAQLCRDRRISVLLLTPGFGPDEVSEIARALDGANVLTFSPVAAHVRRGAVVGFDLVSGRSKILVNLAQAGRQRVAFRSDLLNLAVVVR
jgi:hypothetical protein